MADIKRGSEKPSGRKTKKTARSAGAVKNKPAAKRAKTATPRRRSKKKGGYGFVIAVAAVAACIVIGMVIFDRVSNPNVEGKLKCELYFVNKTTSKLEVETRMIASGDSKTVLENVTSELIAGPKSSSLSVSIPKELKILKLSYAPSEKSLAISVSEEYRGLSISDELFCRSALVKTFTSLDFVESVTINIDGEELKKTDGQDVGGITGDSVLTDSNLTSTKAEYRTVTLYFSDEMGDWLVPEERTIVVNSNSMLEQYIMQELIKGPLNEGLTATVPSDTKVGTISIDGGTCVVDLNPDFLSKIQVGSTNERLAVYSVVNTLTSLNSVKQVQFLFNGVKGEIKGGHLDISSPFERNEDIILK